MVKVKKILIILSVILSVIFLVSVYSKILVEDHYLPYWDAYENKFNSEALNLQPLPNNFSDPLFFYNLKIFREITNLDYFQIMRYGPLFLVSLLFLFLIFFFNKTYSNEKGTILIMFSTIIFMLILPIFVRMSMLLRENLTLLIGILSLYYLITKDNQKQSRSDFIVGTLLLLYTLLSSLLVFLVISLILIINFLINRLYRNKLKEYLYLTISIFILALPILLILVKNLFTQISHGEELITNLGFSVSYNLIRFDLFDLRLMIPLVLFGLIIFIILKKNTYNMKFSISLIITGILIFFSAYISPLGIKQNRFIIYLGIFSVYFLFLSLKYLNGQNRKILCLVLTLLLIISVSNLSNYQIYRPINEDNVQFLLDNPNKLQNISFCGRSAWDAIHFLNFNYSCENFLNSNKIAGENVLLFKDDYNSQEILLKIQNVNFSFYEDQNSKSRIYYFYNDKTSKN